MRENFSKIEFTRPRQYKYGDIVSSCSCAVLNLIIIEFSINYKCYPLLYEFIYALILYLKIEDSIS